MPPDFSGGFLFGAVSYSGVFFRCSGPKAIVANVHAAFGER